MAKTDAPLVLTGTCNQCRGTFTLSTAAQHRCQDEHVTRTGRCEDYPCCGHPRGQCADRAEYTSAYWAELQERMDPDAYERYCEYVDTYGV